MLVVPYVVKEGTTVAFRAHFKVCHDTVLGLEFRVIVRYRDMMDAITDETRLGSFAPLNKEYVQDFCKT